jgi:hypothetical protein
VFALGFRWTQPGSVLALLTRNGLLDALAILLLLRFLLLRLNLFVFLSFLLRRVLRRRRKVEDGSHAEVFAEFEASIWKCIPLEYNARHGLACVSACPAQSESHNAEMTSPAYVRSI